MLFQPFARAESASEIVNDDILDVAGDDADETVVSIASFKSKINVQTFVIRMCLLVGASEITFFIKHIFPLMRIISITLISIKNNYIKYLQFNVRKVSITVCFIIYIFTL